MLAFAAGILWLLLLSRRKRTGQPPVLRPDMARVCGAAGVVLWIGGLTFGLRDVPLGPAAAMFCAAAALTTLVARVILRDRLPTTVLMPAALALAGAVMANGTMAGQGGLVAAAGVGWAGNVLLIRRGDPLDALSAHLILATPVAVLLMLGLPPLRGEALVLAISCAAILSVGVLSWHRLVTVPALAPLAIGTSVLGLIWGEGPVLALVPAAVGAFWLQRMIGSSGS